MGTVIVVFGQCPWHGANREWPPPDGRCLEAREEGESAPAGEAGAEVEVHEAAVVEDEEVEGDGEAEDVEEEEERAAGGGCRRCLCS